MIIKESFNEKDNIIPTKSNIEINIKLILSISNHHFLMKIKLFIDFFIY